MLNTYRDQTVDWHGAKPLPAGVFWIDLINPTPEEKSIVEKAVGVSIPSEEALSEIEASSRLVFDHGLLHLISPPSGSTNMARPN